VRLYSLLGTAVWSDIGRNGYSPGCVPDTHERICYERLVTCSSGYWMMTSQQVYDVELTFRLSDRVPTYRRSPSRLTRMGHTLCTVRGAWPGDDPPSYVRPSPVCKLFVPPLANIVDRAIGGYTLRRADWLLGRHRRMPEQSKQRRRLD